MNFEIIKANLEDLDDVWNIVDICSKDLYKQGMNHWIEFYTKDRISKKIKELNVFILKTNNQIVGIICVDFNVPKFYYEFAVDFFDYNIKAAYFSMLGVNPRYQKKSYGTELIKFAEKFTKENEIDLVRFNVLKSHKELNEYYQKKGYMLKGSDNCPNEEMNYYEKKLG